MCKAGHSLFLHSGRCLSSCPAGYYENAEGLCEACDSSCWTCDNNNRDCLSCADGLYLENRRCVANCSPRYYPDEDGTCKHCSAHCNICSDPQICIKCSYLYLLLNGTCKATCPDSYFEDLDSGKCILCYYTCSTCSGSSSNNCETCSLNYPKLYQGQCLENCPVGTTYNTLAMECQGDVKLCRGLLNQCYIQFNLLPLQFPTDRVKTSFIISLLDGRPLAWASNLWECQDSRLDNPVQFITAFRRVFDESSRRPTAASELLQLRQACDRTCASCSSSEPTDCIQCQHGLTLDPVSRMCGVQGEAECPLKTFLQGDQFTCKTCDETCQSCDGPSPRNCLTCSVPYYLHNNTCIKECPPGMYSTTEEANGLELGYCSKCNQVCSNCSGGSAKDCTTCAEAYYKLQHLCILHCPLGYYRESNHCEKCDPSCHLCYGPGPESCLDCPSNTYQVDGTNQCVSQCPERFYQQKQKCIPCHPSCKTCKDSAAEGCLSCDWGSDFKEGVCFPRCEEHRYLDTDEVCKLCDPSCRHCSGPGPNHCILCKASSAWSLTEKRCIKCCDPQIVSHDCCFCKSNTVLCIKYPQMEMEHVSLEKNLIPPVSGSMTISHFSLLPVLAFLVIFSGVIAFSLWQARAKKKLCWKQSYERLNGNPQPILFHENDDHVVLKDSGTADESSDECDVVYTSQDGTMYRKYSFKSDGEEYKDEQTYLSKAKC
ncbi:proprotein convertase subtilisin/kexin type 5-like [Rhinatrema bivittatum]|uniref:proprotein convertase subtilisin/kexin type 5-like n=1 Tax=Rhinatrema bivittatum TaxID=194408 RepID=UPI00112CCDF5|nr:proprotein convertase subtilisin/kexin type 5-like [Rhinatrema bivittatum]